jgi:ceroid-lipofuscinosis MFS transporter 7
MYTAPAYVMTLVCAATLLCLYTFFKDRQREPTVKVKKLSAKRTLIEEVSNQKTMCGMLTIYDACILGCMMLNIATKGSIASFETLGIAYAETHFDMLSQQAGSLVGTCGTIGVFALLSMGFLSKHFTDIQLISGGMITMALGIVSLAGIQEGMQNSNWRYFLAIFMIYSIGYPIGHTAVIGLFSKSKSCLLPCCCLIIVQLCFRYQYLTNPLLLSLQLSADDHKESYLDGLLRLDPWLA